MLKQKNMIAAIVVILLAVLQLGLLTKFIYAHESLTKNGIVYKFALEPVDPYDAFRGRYLALNFALFAIPNSDNYRNKVVNVELEADEDGFAKVKSIQLKEEIPASDSYIETKYNYYRLTWPFSRFYLQDEYARLTDQYLNEIITQHKVYATIAVKNGAGRILDIYVDDIPMIEFLKTNYQ